VPTFKLTIAYDGTGFVGWQRQPAGTSIQALVEDACRPLTDRPVAVTAAGRTDAGVHALGQVASLRIDRPITPHALARALNARLPPAVRVRDAAEVPDGFHARFSARSKTYRYRIWNAEVLLPFERNYAWHVQAPLDTDAMRRAAKVLVGRHDFAAMQAAGSGVQTTVRTLFDVTVDRQDALVVVQLSGDGFLRHMVRNLVGALVEIGRGRRPPEWLAGLIASRDRTRGGPTAPAGGLCLVRVDYEEP
jgi:tRNA pseudouridine38-40 synthase